MPIQPYLFFEGRCDEALDFYRGALGAEVSELMRFRDSPDPEHNCGPGTEDKVMHATVQVGDSAFMVSDGMCNGQPAFQGFSISIMAKDTAEAERLFNALGEGGQVQMPLGETFWSPMFGMVADRFGVSWMINTCA